MQLAASMSLQLLILPLRVWGLGSNFNPGINSGISGVGIKLVQSQNPGIEKNGPGLHSLCTV